MNEPRFYDYEIEPTHRSFHRAFWWCATVEWIADDGRKYAMSAIRKSKDDAMRAVRDDYERNNDQ